MTKTKKYIKKNNKTHNKIHNKKHNVRTKSRCIRGGSITNPNIQPITLTISYPPQLNIINHKQDLTNYKQLYVKPPVVKINNVDPNSKKIYLISMTDPDVPNGIENKNKFDNNNTISRTWTHWVFTCDANNKILDTYVFYNPPSPPQGTHRYVFDIYDVTNINLNKLEFHSESINSPVNRNTYYDNYLKKLKNIKQCKLTQDYSSYYVVKA